MNTTDHRTELDLRQFAQALKQRVWLVAGLVVGTAVAVYVFSSFQTDLYQAASEVRVVDSGGVFSEAERNPEREITNQLYFMESSQLRLAVNQKLGEEARNVSDISITRVAGTDVVRVRALSALPDVAMRAADTYTQTYVELRRSAVSASRLDSATDLRDAADELGDLILEIDSLLGLNPPAAQTDVYRAQRQGFVQQQSDFIQQATQLEVEADLGSDGIQVLEPAILPRNPVSPKPARDAVLAASAAIAIAVGVVFLLELLDNRISSTAQVEALTGVPVLGGVPQHGAARRWNRGSAGRDESLVKLTSASAEAYRTLQTSLRFSSLGKAKRRIAVTSASGGEGKTTVTANLARVLAESGLRVVVVSADLRRPMIGKVFGVDESQKGLSSVLLGDATLAECLQPVTFDSGRSLALLPSGPLANNPAELLASDAFGALLERIEAADVDFILLDCAPVLPVSDPLAVTQHVDGVIVLCVAEKTRRASLVETMDRLRQVEADVIGIVVNGVPRKSGYYYGYGSYYGYYTYGRTYGADLDDERSGNGSPSGGLDGWLRKAQDAAGRLLTRPAAEARAGSGDEARD